MNQKQKLEKKAQKEPGPWTWLWTPDFHHDQWVSVEIFQVSPYSSCILSETAKACNETLFLPQQILYVKAELHQTNKSQLQFALLATHVGLVVKHAI